METERQFLVRIKREAGSDETSGQQQQPPVRGSVEGISVKDEPRQKRQRSSSSERRSVSSSSSSRIRRGRTSGGHRKLSLEERKRLERDRQRQKEREAEELARVAQADVVVSGIKKEGGSSSSSSSSSTSSSSASSSSSRDGDDSSSSSGSSNNDTSSNAKSADSASDVFDIGCKYPARGGWTNAILHPVERDDFFGKDGEAGNEESFKEKYEKKRNQSAGGGQSDSHSEEREFGDDAAEEKRPPISLTKNKKAMRIKVRVDIAGEQRKVHKVKMEDNIESSSSTNKKKREKSKKTASVMVKDEDQEEGATLSAAELSALLAQKQQTDTGKSMVVQTAIKQEADVYNSNVEKPEEKKQLLSKNVGGRRVIKEDSDDEDNTDIQFDVDSSNDDEGQEEMPWRKKKDQKREKECLDGEKRNRRKESASIVLKKEASSVSSASSNEETAKEQEKNIDKENLTRNIIERARRRMRGEPEEEEDEDEDEEEKEEKEKEKKPDLKVEKERKKGKIETVAKVGDVASIPKKARIAKTESPSLLLSKTLQPPPLPAGADATSTQPPSKSGEEKGSSEPRSASGSRDRQGGMYQGSKRTSPSRQQQQQQQYLPYQQSLYPSPGATQYGSGYDSQQQQHQLSSRERALPKREPTDLEIRAVNDLDALIEIVMKPFAIDEKERIRVRNCNSVDLAGSFLNPDDQYDFFDKDERTGKIVLQPKIPMFPEDFPPGKPEWPLSWWGINEPSEELMANRPQNDGKYSKLAAYRMAQYRQAGGASQWHRQQPHPLQHGQQHHPYLPPQQRPSQPHRQPQRYPSQPTYHPVPDDGFGAWEGATGGWRPGSVGTGPPPCHPAGGRGPGQPSRGGRGRPERYPSVGR